MESYLKNLIHYRPCSLQPQDFPKPQKRYVYNFPSSSRVLDPSLLTDDTIKRNLSSQTLINNGNWNRMLNRTCKEESISGQRPKSNPKIFSSSVFTGESNERNIRHNKATIFTNYSHKTQIYTLPGGVKREGHLVKDDKKNYDNKKNYAFFMKRDREFGPVIVEKDPPNDNKSQFLGGYGYRDKNKSRVFEFIEGNAKAQTVENQRRKVFNGIIGNNNRGKRRLNMENGKECNNRGSQYSRGKNLFRSQFALY